MVNYKTCFGIFTFLILFVASIIGISSLILEFVENKQSQEQTQSKRFIKLEYHKMTTSRGIWIFKDTKTNKIYIVPVDAMNIIEISE